MTRRITITTHCAADGTWTATIYVGTTAHCGAARSSRSEAVAVAVACFRAA